MPLSRLLYVSVAVVPMTLEALEEMVGQARRVNARSEITGLLVYGGGHFMQVLEGEFEDVRRLYQKISKDKRHTNVQLLQFSYCRERLFQEWHMGLENLDSIKPLDVQRWETLLSDQEWTSESVAVLEIIRDFCQKVSSQTSVECGQNTLSESLATID